jgi:hypothetical protein
VSRLRIPHVSGAGSALWLEFLGFAEYFYLQGLEETPTLMPISGKTLLSRRARLPPNASMGELSAAIVALVAPFDYPNVAAPFWETREGSRRCISPTGI